MFKVLWLFNHPAPYKIDFFNQLGEQVDLTAIFERTSEGDRGKAFYYEKAKNFKEIILSSLKLGNYNNFTNAIIPLIKKGHYDIIVINGWSTLSEMKTIRYLKRHKIPYIFAINGGIARDNEPQWKKRLKEKYLPGAALYLSPDPFSSTYLTYYGVDEKRIRLFPYSTIFKREIQPRSLSAEEKQTLRQQEHLPAGPLYLSVGSFIPRKNDDQLLRIWSKLTPEKTLLLIGDGPEKERFQHFIEDHKLHNVLILPFKPHDEILRYFRMADASIFLTKEDIYGHVVNECLSQGTPVIASENANSARHLIEEGKNGYLVSLDKEDEILKVLEKPLTPSFGEEALKTAKENTIESMCQAHLKIFQEFLSL